MEHRLKTWPIFYWDVVSGVKKFEIRKNDREFQVGDTLILQEYYPETERFTGNEFSVIIDYTISLNGLPGIPDGFIGMGILPKE